MIVLGFSVVALGLGVKLLQEGPGQDGADMSQPVLAVNSQTSPIMAIVIDAVAPLYLLWITNDEYRGKPLGLRSATAKLRLILLDLLFIVFDSANLSLAFEAAHARDVQLREYSAVVHSDSVWQHLRLQWSLACVLMVALIAWLMTFSISALR